MRPRVRDRSADTATTCTVNVTTNANADLNQNENSYMKSKMHVCMNLKVTMPMLARSCDRHGSTADIFHLVCGGERMDTYGEHMHKLRCERSKQTRTNATPTHPANERTTICM